MERNPVRAGLVRKAEGYRWSSTAAHCQIRKDPVLTTKAGWWVQVHAIDDWSSWLAEGDEPKKFTVIRRNIEKGLPCGSETFLKKLEKKVGRVLIYQPQGRPKTHVK